MAYLMQTEEMDASTAQATVASLRHVVKPNDGFLKQLGVWEEMGSLYDDSHAYVKRKALQDLKEQHDSGESIEKEDLAEANGDSKDGEVRNSAKITLIGSFPQFWGSLSRPAKF